MNDFDKVVSIKLGQEWVAVGSVGQALACLRERWPVASGSSLQRALANCEAAMAGHGSAVAARTAFVVAAMEAGLPFELHKDEFGFLESEIAAAAENFARGKQADDEGGNQGEPH